MPTVERVAGPRVSVRDVGEFSHGDTADVSGTTATYLVETVGGFQIATDETTDGYDGDESSEEGSESQPESVSSDDVEICGAELSAGGTCERPADECPYHGDD